MHREIGAEDRQPSVILAESRMRTAEAASSRERHKIAQILDHAERANEATQEILRRSFGMRQAPRELTAAVVPTPVQIDGLLVRLHGTWQALAVFGVALPTHIPSHQRNQQHQSKDESASAQEKLLRVKEKTG
jgi:hypothetical protein